jgi:hypothetical protein
MRKKIVLLLFGIVIITVVVLEIIKQIFLVFAHIMKEQIENRILRTVKLK